MTRTILTRIVAMLVLVGGCETPGRPQKVLEARTVEIPIVRPCTGTVPKGKTEQEYADFNLPLDPASAAERYRRISKANEQRRERLAVVEPAVEACR